ncbi:MAG: M28 family peptidase [Euryarchaeota archaeon]|nr:M28 family peptidase [Euryarchaeota archaeon]
MTMKTPWQLPITLALVFMVLAGCAADPDDAATADPLAPYLDESGRSVVPFQAGAVTGAVTATAGGLATITGDGASVVLPSNVWVFQDGRFQAPKTEPWSIPADGLEFLVPPFAENLSIEVHGPDHETVPLTVSTPYVEGEAFVDGAHIMDLYDIQRDEYPHRTPGQPNYKASQLYFERYFQDLGYEVSRDPYGFTDMPQLPTDATSQTRNIQAGSMANVVAYRPGTGSSDRIVAFGGHYDAVENTREAAFDDTSGTLATLALARAFADVQTDVGLLFGLWGGEEDGLLGSQFFVRSNPDIVARTILYVNLDVVSMAWPGPAVNPDPIVVSAGPDGPVADDLLSQGAHIFQTYVPEMPEGLQIYEAVAEGQAGTVPGVPGSGVNAQSDHTPFITSGVPSYFAFAGNVSNVFAFIHGPQDTIYNMTWFMATNEPLPEGTSNPPLEPERLAHGRHLLLRSFEAQLALPLYMTLEIDSGVYKPPVKDQA